MEGPPVAVRDSRGSRAAQPLVAALLLLVVLGEQVVTSGPLTRLDRDVESFLVPHRANAGVELARQLTWLGNPTLMVPLLLALTAVVALRRRSWLVPLRVLALLVALAVTVLTLKGVIARPAPHGGDKHGGAWPSGHAATATVVWGAVARLLTLRGGSALAVQAIAGAVGVCLVLAGYHQVSDVVAGWALGAALLLVADRTLGR